MLSPHELATLMLVKAAPERVDAGREEVGVLRELELIAIERPDAGRTLPHVTPRGEAILRAIARAR
ncbi:hypothetical protein M3I53_35880 [Paraburkholderia sp. CNPSo 3272]|uniref:hypothetical protein n=1 Tax=Paraburkholderia sp. CNPSo 3272 TaxID=2940931 RepID=UPI0020B79B9A|nr:hypothetical protein [Paraburkholderia sp. CNPSo 3272]MCP3728429.1 hypothetical protein [Paraburkholderia sp. CNPSo 3272]